MTQHFNSSKLILYIDMDGVVADFEKSIKIHMPEWETLNESEKGEQTDKICGNVEGFFRNLNPINNAVDTVKRLSLTYDVYFLSAAMWNVPQSYTDKRLWIEEHFGDTFKKRLILTHRKDLNYGHILIDDRTSHGASNFLGKHILFGSPEFPDWKSVEEFLISFKMNTKFDFEAKSNNTQ
jgi:5'(3')-deoxyribonucleotidase